MPGRCSRLLGRRRFALVTRMLHLPIPLKRSSIPLLKLSLHILSLESHPPVVLFGDEKLELVFVEIGDEA